MTTLAEYELKAVEDAARNALGQHEKLTGGLPTMDILLDCAVKLAAHYPLTFRLALVANFAAALANQPSPPEPGVPN